MLTFDFSSGYQFFKFFSHSSFYLASRDKVRNIKQIERPKSKTNRGQGSEPTAYQQ